MSGIDTTPFPAENNGDTVQIHFDGRQVTVPGPFTLEHIEIIENITRHLFAVPQGYIIAPSDETLTKFMRRGQPSDIHMLAWAVPRATHTGRLFVRHLSGKATTLQVDFKTNTISDIKDMLQVREGCPPDQQCLLSRSHLRIMKDEMIIGHYFLEEPTLYLILRHWSQISRMQMLKAIVLGPEVPPPSEQIPGLNIRLRCYNLTRSIAWNDDLVAFKRDIYAAFDFHSASQIEFSKAFVSEAGWTEITSSTWQSLRGKIVEVQISEVLTTNSSDSKPRPTQPKPEGPGVSDYSYE